MAISLPTGCTVGPDFTSPVKPEVPAYTATPPPTQTAGAPPRLGEAQHFSEESGINPQWWQELASA